MLQEIQCGGDSKKNATQARCIRGGVLLFLSPAHLSQYCTRNVGLSSGFVFRRS
jgi:hypothetical protein